MVKLAFLVRLEAKPGKEADVEAFLRSGLPLVEQEPGTTTWYGIKLGRRPTASSTPSPTTRGGKPIYRAKLPPRSFVEKFYTCPSCRIR